MAKLVRVAVAGANGYAGMGLVQMLAAHPGVEIATMTSRSFAGQPYSSVFPLLSLEGRFSADAATAAEGADVVFSCLPHNSAASLAGRWLNDGARVIDMSADFRLQDATLYPTWYKQEHPDPALLGQAVLGLPERHADRLAAARLIAVPGCYATASILALLPAAEAGLIGSDVVIDAKSGVSGAGRSPGLGSHFSEVNESLGAYAIAGHRHLPEIVQEIGAAGGRAVRLTFVPHLVPMTRGILVTCYFDLAGSVEQLMAAYEDRYLSEPFTRVVAYTPTTKLASHTNLCLVNVAAQGRKAVVTAALDNLVKGASGQGVECFNLALGFERTLGLEARPQWP